MQYFYVVLLQTFDVVETYYEVFCSFWSLVRIQFLKDSLVKGYADIVMM